MKQFFTILLLVATAGAVQAQPMLSNGFNTIAAINGTTYQKTANLAPGRNFGHVSASADGQYFYAAGAFPISNMIFYITVAGNAFVDSMTLPSSNGDMASVNEINTLFSLRGTSLYRINTSAKTYDSIVIGNPFRVEERPGAKEVWVAADSMIYVVNYTSALSFSTIDISSNKFDNADVRFTKGGSLAYKSATSLKKIYKVDCSTKAIIDSIDTSPYSPFSIEVSTDSSKIYAANGNAVYVYSVASKALIDSMVGNKPIMNLYRHPGRQEVWAVHHFNDSVTVFNETNKAIIASFDIGNDPFFLAFATGSAGVNDLQANYNVQLYPNPAGKELTVILPDNKEKQLVVYDCFGRRLMTNTSTSLTTRMNIASLAAGNYYLAVYEHGALVKTMPFVKE